MNVRLERNLERPRLARPTMFVINPRQNVVFLGHIFFIFILLEGILRKWLLNSIEQPIYLIRDPIALIMIFEYLRYKKLAIPLWMKIWLGHVFFFALIACLQGVLEEAGAVPLIIGMRNYFLFIPVAFIIGDTFEEKDIKLFFTYALALCIPIGYLVFLQYKSPVSSPINKGISDEIAGRFTILNGIVRPYGVFTFTAGHVVFSTLMTSVAFCAVALYSRLKVPFYIVVSSVVAILIMGLLSGSRTYFMGVFVIITFYFFSSLVGRDYKKVILQFVGGCFVMALMYVILTQVFPIMYDTMLLRQSTATRSEGETSLRLLTVVTEFLKAMPNVPFLGRGIGLGTNAGGYASSGSRSFLFAEYEWTRLIYELGPILGFYIICVRLALSAWLVKSSFTAAARFNSPGGLIVLGSLIPNLAFGSLTLQNSILAVTWFSVGLVLAMNRAARNTPFSAHRQSRKNFKNSRRIGAQRPTSTNVVSSK